MPQAAHRPYVILFSHLTQPEIRESACQLKIPRSKLELLAVRDISMARGNQRDKAREKNQKELSAQVSFPVPHRAWHNLQSLGQVN